MKPESPGRLPRRARAEWEVEGYEAEEIDLVMGWIAQAREGSKGLEASGASAHLQLSMSSR